MLPRAGRYYRRMLTAVVRRPLRAAAMCLILPVLGFLLLGTIDTEFFPPADRDQFENPPVHVSTPRVRRTERQTNADLCRVTQIARI